MPPKRKRETRDYHTPIPISPRGNLLETFPDQNDLYQVLMSETVLPSALLLIIINFIQYGCNIEIDGPCGAPSRLMVTRDHLYSICKLIDDRFGFFYGVKVAMTDYQIFALSYIRGCKGSFYLEDELYFFCSTCWHWYWKEISVQLIPQRFRRMPPVIVYYS